MIEVKRRKKIHKNRLEGNRFHCKRRQIFQFFIETSVPHEMKSLWLRTNNFERNYSVYIRQFLVIVVVISFFYRLFRNFSRLCSSRHRSFILCLSFYIDYVSLQRIVYYIVNERGENRIDSKCQVIFEIDVNISKSIRSKEANVSFVSWFVIEKITSVHTFHVWMVSHSHRFQFAFVISKSFWCNKHSFVGVYYTHNNLTAIRRNNKPCSVDLFYLLLLWIQ